MKWSATCSFWLCSITTGAEADFSSLIVHTGHGNLDINYNMGDTVLGTTVKEKDLGIKINADMKVSEQCDIAASMGNQMIGLTRRNITYKDKL